MQRTNIQTHKTVYNISEVCVCVRARAGRSAHFGYRPEPLKWLMELIAELKRRQTTNRTKWEKTTESVERSGPETRPKTVW